MNPCLRPRGLGCARLIIVLLLCFILPAAAPARAADAPANVRAIIAEATRPDSDPAGRPLPLAGHWNTGQYSRARGMDPDWQMDQIAAGRHLLPWFQLNAPHWGQMDAKYYQAAMKRAAAWGLPVTFVGTQFESMLTDDKQFFDLPAERNPNVIDPQGKVLKMVSPFGPVEPWREAGRRWTTLPVVAQCQQWHPNPPRVVFLSNNEHSRLTWKDAERSKRYLDKYGKGRDGEFRRKVFADGWIERYRALQAGMRDGLTAEAWRTGATFVGYDAFGPAHLARWGGWAEYSLWIKGRIDPNPLIWDGASPSYYVHNWNPSTDYTVWGPQVESCNWLFMLDEALKLNPNFWWEISVWDGHEAARDDDMRKVYARRGQTYGPPRYLGFVQLGMWLLRPRVVREFRGWTDSQDEMLPYFKQIMDAVDRVHADPTLTEFWRKGRLVANRARKHPYQQALPEEYKDVDRWFLLDTDLTPAGEWKLDTAIPVFAVALELGQPPARRWLVYAHAPLGDRKGVKIELPGFGSVTADVAVAGTFILVEETGRNVRPL